MTFVSKARGPLGYAIISTSTDGATIVAAVSGKSIRVLSYSLVVSGAVTVAFASASTDVTGAMSFAADGSGISVPYSPIGHFETVKGEALTIQLGGAVGVRGHLSYELVD